MTEPKLTYGIDSETKKLIHIKDTLRGLRCDCICPNCGAHLLAKQGEKNEWHFAHYNAPECTGAQMTIIHRMAQEILVESCCVMLPKFERPSYRLDPTVINFDYVRPETSVFVDNIRRRPDCIGFKDGRELWIEILVNHAVDKEKEYDIRKLGISCIEIDCSQFGSDISREKLQSFLLSVSNHRKWINAPICEANAEKAAIEAEKKKAEEQAQLAEEARREAVSIQEWLKVGDLETANHIYGKLKHTPFAPIDYYKELVSQGTIFTYLNHSPITEGGESVFFSLLKLTKQHWTDIKYARTYHLPAIRSNIAAYLSKKHLTTEDTIRFHENAALFLLYLLYNASSIIFIKNGDRYQLQSIEKWNIAKYFKNNKTIRDGFFHTLLTTRSAENTSLEARFAYALYTQTKFESCFHNVSNEERIAAAYQQMKKLEEEKYQRMLHEASKPYEGTEFEHKLGGLNKYELLQKIKDNKMILEKIPDKTSLQYQITQEQFEIMLKRYNDVYRESPII